MQRRDVGRVVGGITASGIIPLTGCLGTDTGGSSISGEVTTNEISDTLTVQSHRASLTEDGAYLYLTIENTTSEVVDFWYQGQLYKEDELVRESRKTWARRLQTNKKSSGKDLQLILTTLDDTN